MTSPGPSSGQASSRHRRTSSSSRSTKARVSARVRRRIGTGSKLVPKGARRPAGSRGGVLGLLPASLSMRWVKAVEMASVLEWMVLDGADAPEHGPGFHVMGCEMDDAIFTTESREWADQLCALLNYLT
jgi:hypothetical protein